MTEYEEKALVDLLLDIDCLKKLEEWTNDINLFDVLKISNLEIRHSNILAWLLNPNENHGLGDLFIRKFIIGIAQKRNRRCRDGFDLLLQNFYSYQVFREKDHMDIVLYSQEEQTSIIVENKIWADESSDQLKRYYHKSRHNYRDCTRILYVFLTPDGHDASDPDRWISMSYQEVAEYLESSISGIVLQKNAEVLIRDYLSIVRRKIMREKDERLVRVCNEIYNKHRAALQLIFENVVLDNSSDSEIVFEALRKLHQERRIIFKDENRWEFFTPSMDEYLPNLEKSESSWGTNKVYYYWMEKSGEKLVLHLEIGGWNLTETLKGRTDALLKACNKQAGEYRYKRIYYNCVNLSQNDYEESLKNAVNSLVTDALEKERQLLSEAKNQL